MSTAAVTLHWISTCAHPHCGNRVAHPRVRCPMHASVPELQAVAFPEAVFIVSSWLVFFCAQRRRASA